MSVGDRHDARIAAEGLSPPFTLADVGARGGPPATWRDLIPPVAAVCFEPDGQECERLRAGESSPNVRYEPIALGAEHGTATLHMTRDPACASLYPPDDEVVSGYPELDVAASTGEQLSVPIRTLDQWCATAGVSVDALKLDVQGAELDVLRGAERRLEEILMIEVEVEFKAIYRQQPLFADVDAFLQDHGFVLWRLGHLVHYSPTGLDSSTPIDDLQVFDSRRVEVVGQGGQLFWGHAWYLAADALSSSAADERKTRAAVAAVAFGFPDLAVALTR